MKSFNIKPIINKSNGQINFSFPKKKLSKDIKKDILKIKSFKIKIDGYDLI